jgi:hypothetical protein
MMYCAPLSPHSTGTQRSNSASKAAYGCIRVSNTDETVTRKANVPRFRQSLNRYQARELTQHQRLSYAEGLAGMGHEWDEWLIEPTTPHFAGVESENPVNTTDDTRQVTKTNHNSHLPCLQQTNHRQSCLVGHAWENDCQTMGRCH